MDSSARVPGLWLAGNEGMEKRMEIIRMTYMLYILRLLDLQNWIPNLSPQSPKLAQKVPNSPRSLRVESIPSYPRARYVTVSTPCASISALQAVTEQTYEPQSKHLKGRGVM